MLRGGAGFDLLAAGLIQDGRQGLPGSIWTGESDEKSVKRLRTRLKTRSAIEGDPPIKRREAGIEGRAYLERGAESGTALEEGNPEGMFGLSGTTTRERIPTHNVVGSRPRAASYCDHPNVLPLSHQNSSSELSSVGEFSGHSLIVPHPMTEIAVFNHLHRANAPLLPYWQQSSSLHPPHGVAILSIAQRRVAFESFCICFCIHLRLLLVCIP